MDYISENNRRRKKLKEEEDNYDPITGFGCVGERKQLKLSDAPYTAYLPVQMFEEEVIQELVNCKSIAKLYAKNGIKNVSEEEIDQFWFDLCELRYKYDYEFYAVCTQTILHKIKGKLVSFVLNPPQRDILEEFESVNHFHFRQVSV